MFCKTNKTLSASLVWSHSYTSQHLTVPTNLQIHPQDLNFRANTQGCHHPFLLQDAIPTCNYYCNIQNTQEIFQLTENLFEYPP